MGRTGFNNGSAGMRITMIGSGYVGLVSGACFSDFGHDVCCVDKDEGKIAALKAGRMPIYEPGLDQLVAANVTAGRLTFTTDLAQAVAGADAIFIAVGTPSRRGDGHADLSYVFAATEEIAAALTGPAVDRARRHRRPGLGDPARTPPRHRRRGRLQPRIPARGRRDRRLQAARPHRHRHRGRQ